MKQTRKCPKCASRRLWRIEEFRVDLHASVSIALADRSMWTGATTQGKLDLYVCAECGYAELWGTNLDELHHNPESGIHLIEPDEPGAVYR